MDPTSPSGRKKDCIIPAGQAAETLNLKNTFLKLLDEYMQRPTTIDFLLTALNNLFEEPDRLSPQDRDELFLHSLYGAMLSGHLDKRQEFSALKPYATLALERLRLRLQGDKQEVKESAEVTEEANDDSQVVVRS